MPKCDNCSADAVYAIQDPGSRPQDFCDAHLPRVYHSRRDAGHLTRHSAIQTAETPVEAVAEPVAESTPKKRTRKKAVAPSEG